MAGPGECTTGPRGCSPHIGATWQITVLARSADRRRDLHEQRREDARGGRVGGRVSRGRARVWGRPRRWRGSWSSAARVFAYARTRAAYGRTVGQFLGWCEARGLRLRDVSPLYVAAYIRTHPGSVPTVKQHLAAIRMLGDWLVVVSQVLPLNPAAAVRGPTHVVTKGATPVLSPAEARKLRGRAWERRLSGRYTLRYASPDLGQAGVAAGGRSETVGLAAGGHGVVRAMPGDPRRPGFRRLGSAGRAGPGPARLLALRRPWAARRR